MEKVGRWCWSECGWGQPEAVAQVRRLGGGGGGGCG